MTTKRHAKPTSAQLAARTYRKVIELEKSLTNQIALNRVEMECVKSGQRMLSERIESCRVLADHCARLLKEKVTVQRQLAEANAYLAHPAVHVVSGNTLASSLAMTPPVLRDAITEPKRVQAELTGRPHWRGPSKCGFSAIHRPGIKCFVCGETPA